ncbi:unnamed protein product [Tilletia caries]|nr:unnamed protein product [Tilletia controversa]CAD6956165.1 unnamed protein product [Tilletia caries]CAD7064482.1 unnamed protein product [Tilletia caries]
MLDLASDDDDPATDEPAVKRCRGPAVTTQLAGTVGDLATAQVELAEKERLLRTSQHKETMEAKKEDRELQERMHNDQQEHQERQLRLEEKKFEHQFRANQRMDALELQVQRAASTAEATLSFIQAKFPSLSCPLSLSYAFESHFMLLPLLS